MISSIEQVTTLKAMRDIASDNTGSLIDGMGMEEDVDTAYKGASPSEAYASYIDAMELMGEPVKRTIITPYQPDFSDSVTSRPSRPLPTPIKRTA